VVLGHPLVNALNQRAYRVIHRFFSRTDAFIPDESVIALVADGPHFCAGKELTEVSTMTSQKVRVRLFRARESLYAV
jgi:enoyl-CoA hydratase/carnithine racemase